MLICFLTGGLLGGGLMLLVSLAKHHGWHPHHHAWQILASNFLLYLPICFVVEEVFFRGGIDSYLQQPGDKHGWLTAIFVSVLWGWWHLPIFPIKSVLEIIALFVSLPMITCLSGIAFSLCWRRSGTLLVTATVHALIDSFRNAIM